MAIGPWVNLERFHAISPIESPPVPSVPHELQPPRDPLLAPRPLLSEGEDNDSIE